MTEQIFLEQALRHAQESFAMGCGPFGAVIVSEGRVIASGTNTTMRDCDPTAHAEIAAIRAAGRRLRSRVMPGCVLYSSCEPCPMCLAASYWAGIREIVYAATSEDAAAAGFSDATIYAELVRAKQVRSIAQRNLLRAEGRAILLQYADADGVRREKLRDGAAGGQVGEADCVNELAEAAGAR